MRVGRMRRLVSGRRARRHFHSALIGSGIAHQLVLLMLRIAIGRDVIEVAATHTHIHTEITKRATLYVISHNESRVRCAVTNERI